MRFRRVNPLCWFVTTTVRQWGIIFLGYNSKSKFLKLLKLLPHSFAHEPIGCFRTLSQVLQTGSGMQYHSDNMRSGLYIIRASFEKIKKGCNETMLSTLVKVVVLFHYEGKDRYVRRFSEFCFLFHFIAS